MTETTTPTSAATDASTNPPRATTSRGLWRELRPLLLRIHFYAGIFVSPFIAVATLTGLAFAVAIPLEQRLYQDLTHVTASTAALPLSEQVAAAQVAVPDGEVARVRLADEPDRSTRVEFTTPEFEDFRTAFVDPYTADVLGVQTTNSHYLQLRTWLETFHSTLWLGESGSLYSELAASWLWIIALVGVSMWLTQARKRRRLRSTLLPATTGSPRARMRSWHATIGLAATVGILAISATGLTWSAYAGANVSDVRAAMDWRERDIATELPTPVALTPQAQLAAYEKVLEAARSSGIDGPVVVKVGEYGGAWSVSQDKVVWPMKQDKVTIDPVTGQVVDRLNFDDYPLMAKLATWGIWLHMGVLFGWVNQVALVLLALAILVLIGLGYRMWWKRRPTRGGLAGPPTSERPSARACALVAVLALIVGVALPVMGISLLLFLACDVGRSVLRQRAAAR